MRLSSTPTLILLLPMLLSVAACRGDPMDAPFTDAAASGLAEAAVQGNAHAIASQVRDGADPDAQGKDGINLLQYAIMVANKAGFEALLDSGAKPDAPGFNGTTALHTAAIADDPDYLRMLLAHGADPDAANHRSGETALAVAVSPRTDAQFRMLLDAGANANAADAQGYTPLHRAAMINAGEHVLQLLDAGADPQAKSVQDATFQAYFFTTPEASLSAQARANREKVVAWLRAHEVPLEAGVGE
ncbi:ankyrin repeat domain-containing protein [Luteimonas lutimaris]|uniref:Ankyrin repeat domain-containing protein n=1 Tax=Luteimonas lutimaris TaxID=698645 RepID=A0ABP7MIY8_9GAMM